MPWIAWSSLTVATGVVAASILTVVGFGVLRADPSTSKVSALPPNAAWYAVVAPASGKSVTDYMTCMLDAGFDTEAIGTPPVGQIPTGSISSDAAFQQVFRRCIVEAGLGDFEGDDPAEVAAKNAKAIGITSCMRDLGWAMPEPTVHPVAGHLVPGGPDVPAERSDADQQLADLTNCGRANDIGIVLNES